MAEAAFPFSYPAMLDVSRRACLVVGGGRIAARKAQGLLDCGARVTVVAPDVSPEMEALVPSLHALHRRPYTTGEVAGFRLAVTATGVPAVDGQVSADADAAGVWVNSADDPEHCTFILPAVFRDGAVSVAVSSGGASPALASWLRDRLGAQLDGKALGALAELLAEARQRLRDTGVPTESVDWRALLDGPLPGLVQDGDLPNSRSILASATQN